METTAIAHVMRVKSAKSLIVHWCTNTEKFLERARALKARWIKMSRSYQLMLEVDTNDLMRDIRVDIITNDYSAWKGDWPNISPYSFLDAIPDVP